MTDESIEEAMSQMPGLRENVAAHKPEPTGVDYFAETPGDDPSLAKRQQVEDSDAVQAALDKIPGLRKKMGH
jgi:hypothetical protein